MVNKPIIFMFSGQGSQYYQMGKALFESQERFRYWMTKMDAMVAKMIGRSIVQLLYYERNNKNDVFDRMLYTHPAIFMVEYALATLLKELGIVPDYVLGSSLGEYSAATVAEAISVPEMLELLIGQARVCEQYCKNGGMIAVFDRPDIYHSSSVLSSNSEIASVNFDAHFVVSGCNDGLSIVAEYLLLNDISFQKLPVAHAFHSSAFDPIKGLFIKALEGINFQPQRVPLISCSTVKKVTCLGEALYWGAARNPVLFQQTLLAIEKYSDAVYVDLGPSGTLSNFTKYVLPPDSASENYQILTPFGQDERNLNVVIKAFTKQYNTLN